MALLIISLIIILGIIVLFFYRFKSLKHLGKMTTLDKKTCLEFIGYILGFTLFSLLASIGIMLKQGYQMDAKHITFMVFGSIIFALSFFTFIECFVFYYYKTDLDVKIRKNIKRVMFICIPFMVIFLSMALDAYAPYTTFPLYNGIIINSKGIHLKRYNSSESGFQINWYALTMLGGAVIAYLVCDHHLYKEYKRHGLIETMFILVFLMGVLGARIWYCAVLEHDMTHFFNFQSGGLAIMGGVLFGAITGILYIIFFRKYIPLRKAMDIILPCVLIAQAIGRWGNYFNAEVHGNPVDVKYFWFLPEFIINQMKYSSVATYNLVGTDKIFLPLFFIEGIVNLAGYFIITYLVGKGLKKHLSLGDLFCLYITWYGLTRVILEPLRFQTSDTSTYKYLESYITAWIMFGGGLAGILGLHVYDYLRYHKYTFQISKNNFTDPKCPYFVKPSIVSNNVNKENLNADKKE